MPVKNHWSKNYFNKPITGLFGLIPTSSIAYLSSVWHAAAMSHQHRRL
jgi:hypothetical protein